MRFLVSFALAGFVLLTLTACNSADSARVASSSSPATTVKPNATPAAAQSDGAPRITTSELEALVSKGQAYVVDVLSEDA